MEVTEQTAAGIEQLCINTVRVLSADAVQKANSGHPGNADGTGAGWSCALVENDEL